MDFQYKISTEKSDKRVDKYLANKNSDYSRSYIQKLINNGYVKVNGEKIKNSYNLVSGDIITVTIPEAEELKLKPYKMDLDIIFEDKDIIVINKPADLLVHPTSHEREKTLVNVLLNYTDDLSAIGGVKRPGIVHRLDRDTSGAIVVAKDDQSHKNLVKQFKNRETKKIYRALVMRNLKYNSGKIEAPIGRDPNNRTKMAVVKKNSKKAITYFKVLERFSKFTYLELDLATGRTHQIRVHMAYLGNPILGDKKYCDNLNNTEIISHRQLLHAYNLNFYHPITGQWMEFTADFPEDFNNILNKIK